MLAPGVGFLSCSDSGAQVLPIVWISLGLGLFVSSIITIVFIIIVSSSSICIQQVGGDYESMEITFDNFSLESTS